jgi:hypothetical protein
MRPTSRGFAHVNVSPLAYSLPLEITICFNRGECEDAVYKMCARWVQVNCGTMTTRGWQKKNYFLAGFAALPFVLPNALDVHCQFCTIACNPPLRVYTGCQIAVIEKRDRQPLLDTDKRLVREGGSIWFASFALIIGGL